MTKRDNHAEKITRDVIESYLDCRYKAYLKLTGHGDSARDHRRLLLDGGRRLPLPQLKNSFPAYQGSSRRTHS